MRKHFPRIYGTFDAKVATAVFARDVKIKHFIAIFCKISYKTYYPSCKQKFSDRLCWNRTTSRESPEILEELDQQP